MTAATHGERKKKGRFHRLYVAMLAAPLYDGLPLGNSTYHALRFVHFRYLIAAEQGLLRQGSAVQLA